MSRDYVLLSDKVDPADGFEVEQFEGSLIFTCTDDDVVMLGSDSLKRLRNEIEVALDTNTTRDLFNAREQIKNLEQENREARALIQTLAEGKDNLRREIDNLERRHTPVLSDSKYLYGHVEDMGLELSVKAQDNGIIVDLTLPGTNDVVWTSAVHIGDIDLEVE